MKIKVTNQFYDKENEFSLCKKNTVIDVSEERAKLLINSNLAKALADEQPDTKSETAEKTN